MSRVRGWLCAAWIAAFSCATHAQEPVPFVAGIGPSPLAAASMLWTPKDAPVSPGWSAWFCYGDARSDFRDHRSWIEDLSKRHREAGLAVVVALPTDAARALCTEEPSFAIAALDLYGEGGPGAARCCLQQKGSTEALTCSVERARDRIEAAFAGDLNRTSPGEVDELLDSLLSAIGDGIIARDYVEHCVKSLPHSGEARALQVLEAWWKRGDYDGAKIAFDAAMQQLDGDSVALVGFADLVLRGDRVEDRMAKTLVVALAQAAAASPDGQRTQLVYLRALLRAGQSRLAQRLSERMDVVLGDDVEANLCYATTLMEASDPLPFRAAAEAAVARTDAADVRMHDRHRFAARYEILARCGASSEQRKELLAAYREQVGDYRGSPNNDAWYLMASLDSMGRYDALALALMEEMEQREGDQLDPTYRDTLALAAFRCGQLERAAQQQRIALEQGRMGAGYAERLVRYEAAIALRKKLDAERVKDREARSKR